MKSSLWIVIVVVVGVVGFLMGYSVSAYTGPQNVGQGQAASEHGSGGYGAPSAPKADAGGYGAPAPAPKAAAGGYGQ